MAVTSTGQIERRGPNWGLNALMLALAGLFSTQEVHAQEGPQRAGKIFSSFGQDDALADELEALTVQLQELEARTRRAQERTEELIERRTRILADLERLQPPACALHEKHEWNNGYLCVEDVTSGLKSQNDPSEMDEDCDESSENSSELCKKNPLFGGMYTENKDGTCRYPNTLSGGCSCPASFSQYPTLEWFDPGCGRGRYDDGTRTENCGFTQYQCVNMQAIGLNRDSSFGGIFTENRDGSCRYPNPITGDCKCSAGARTRGLLEWSDGTCSGGRYADGSRTENCGFTQQQCVVTVSKTKEKVPSNSGGAFTKNVDGSCRYGNPETQSTCRCPTGFKTQQIHDFFNPDCTTGRYTDGFRTKNCGVESYACVRN